jgi:putative tricarboxylic transport membrane protein
MGDILLGFYEAFTWLNILFLILGIFFGVIIGAIPGLNAPMAIAIAVPMTYYLPTVAAIGFLVGINKGATFGGSIAAILINTPGTPEAAITTFDGYALTKKGQGEKAMKVALYSDVIGDTFSDLVLILVAAPLAFVALKMGPAEITSVIIFSLALIIALESDSLVKGLIAGCFGILLSCIGMDPMTSSDRLTFDLVELQQGISIIVVGIGMLALSEILLQLQQLRSAGGKGGMTQSVVLSDNPKDRQLSWLELRSCLKTIFRSAGIGTTLGILPGLGAILAAYLGYGAARKASKDPESFGKGNIEGVAAPVSASAAVCGANLVPLFTLGIPGNVAAAMLIGAFVIHGVTPGPLMFEENGVVVYGIFFSLIIANFLNLFIGQVFLRGFAKALMMPKAVIYPAIILICMVGAYAENSSINIIFIMLVTTVLGYFMKLLKYPFISFIIGFILGPRLELALQQMLVISDNGILILFVKPVSAVFMALTAFVLIQAVVKRIRLFREAQTV